MSCEYQLNDSSALVGDPVDVISGANTELALDFQLAGPIPLRWRRHYDSSLNRNLYGLGWGHSHELEHSLRFDVDGIRYTGPLGRTIGFPPMLEDGQRFARGGCVLHRITPMLYRMYRHQEPGLEFEFRNQPITAVTRVFRGKSAIDFQYDERNRLIGIIDSLRRKIRVVCDEFGRIVTLQLMNEAKDEGRRVLEYRYDQAGNLVGGRDPYQNVFSFRYDADHRMIARTDRIGYTFLFDYDKQGRCVRSRGEDGLLDTRLEYHDVEKVTLVTRADGGVWTYLYPTGKLTRIIDPYGGSRELKRDESGRVIEEVDENGNVTRRVYDHRGALVRKVTPLNQAIPVPEREGALGPNERVLPTRIIEFEFGNSYSALRRGEPISLPRVDEFVIKTISDRIRPYLRTQNPRATASLLPGHRMYDDFGNLIKEGGPDGTSRRRLYDGNGNVVRITDCDGSQYIHKIASWDLRHASVNPLGGALAFRYTKTQKLSAMKDRGGSVTEYEHDLKDRLVYIHRHGVVRERYRYDNADNLIEKLDGNGLPILSMEIGPGNLTKSKRLASGQTHAFGYDENGRLLSAATDSAEVLVAYDPHGNRVKDERNGLGITHRFAPANTLIETSYFERYKVAYKRLGHGRLSLADPRGVTHTIYALGRGLVVRTAGNGTRETVQFDEAGRCLLKATMLRRADLWVRKYSYSAEGDLLGVEDNLRGRARYFCDAAHRLVGAEIAAGPNHVFELDLAGNLLRQPGLEGVVLNDGNRLALANGDRFEYNERNHIASRTGRSGATRYVYDSTDMLTSARTPDSFWEAEYDALSRRISKTIGEKKTEFYWDKERLMAELRADGSVRLYVYVDDFALVPFMFLEYESLEAAPESGNGYYIYSDHHGVPLMAEDDIGRTVWSAQIDPYGLAHVDPASTIDLSLRFPGHYFDAETGLHCNGSRYYSPELGRYLQSDPIGIGGGPNLYAYSANPLKHVDVTGLCPTDDDDPPTRPDGPKALAEKGKLKAEPAAGPKGGRKYANMAAEMTGRGRRTDANYKVKIFTPEELEAFRVTAGPDGKLVYAQSGKPVTTRDPKNPPIYVMDQDGNVFVHESPKHGEIHHSSLAGGDDPAAAGQMAVNDGNVTEMDDSSGHYGPNEQPGAPDAAKNELSQQGVDMSNCQTNEVNLPLPPQ